MPSSYLSIANVLKFFETANIVEVCDSAIEAIAEQFYAEFKYVEAAGGLVCNEQDETLMIYCYKHWDLPKGHREGSESFEFCAQREAEEETGVKVARVGRLLRTTLHSYNIYGKWELKLTAWYEMWADSSVELTPQAEEGIVAAEWIGQDRIESCINSSYPTIKEVFAALLE